MARKGENIYKRKDGRWEARYIERYEDGRAIYRYVYGATYIEAKAKRALVQPNPEPGEEERPVPTTFQELAELWLEDARVCVKESTYTRYYRTVTCYLYPKVKNKKLAEMDQRYLGQLMERLLEDGGLRNKSLSAKSVSDIMCVLKAIFRFGKQNGYPCPDVSGVRHPQKVSKKTVILTEENRLVLERQLLESEDLTSLGILFTLFTGVRIGELCGLRWADIDLKAGTASIRRTVERIADLDPLAERKTKLIISEPKTHSSIRQIPLPEFLVRYLAKRKSRGEYYILTGSREFTEPHQFYMRYQKFLRVNRIDRYTFHALRHTFATRCVETGFDTRSLAEILGHSSITTTLSVYVHPTMQQKKVQMERLTPMCIPQLTL